MNYVLTNWLNRIEKNRIFTLFLNACDEYEYCTSTSRIWPTLLTYNPGLQPC